MIVYKLICVQSHEFEGWFKDSAAFDEQASGRKLVCPVCETHEVAKAPMAPAIAGAKQRPVQAAKGSAEELKKMRQFMTGLRKYVKENADYVGTSFPEEARKIHYGEVEHRHIYGEASLGEARDLIEEGVDVAPLPPDPEGAN